MSVSNLVGSTIQSVTGLEKDSERLIIVTDKGTLSLFHGKICCEEVCIVDFNGDVSDLVDGYVSVADRRTNINDAGESYFRTQYTFYTIRTSKGDVDIRWLGRDNGYYSVSVCEEWAHPSEEEEDNYWGDE